MGSVTTFPFTQQSASWPGVKVTVFCEFSIEQCSVSTSSPAITGTNTKGDINSTAIIELLLK